MLGSYARSYDAFAKTWPAMLMAPWRYPTSSHFATLSSIVTVAVRSELNWPRELRMELGWCSLFMRMRMRAAPRKLSSTEFGQRLID